MTENELLIFDNLIKEGRIEEARVLLEAASKHAAKTSAELTFKCDQCGNRLDFDIEDRSYDVFTEFCDQCGKKFRITVKVV
jgi:hypothetical protein